MAVSAAMSNGVRELGTPESDGFCDGKSDDPTDAPFNPLRERPGIEALFGNKPEVDRPENFLRWSFTMFVCCR